MDYRAPAYKPVPSLTPGPIDTPSISDYDFSVPPDLRFFIEFENNNNKTFCVFSLPVRLLNIRVRSSLYAPNNFRAAGSQPEQFATK